MTDFVLGRLKFTFKGAWTSNTAYLADDIVRYGGQTFACITNHTSSAGNGFYNDTVKWSLVTPGTDWKGDWQVNTYYKVNDVVRYGGTVYLANVGHTSNLYPNYGLEADQNKWVIYSAGTDWKGDWQTNTYYKAKDVVKYGGIVYVANVGHTSNISVNYGLEADYSKWVTYSATPNFVGSWTANTRYKVNDVVQYGADLYIVNTPHFSNGNSLINSWTNNEANSTIFVGGLQFEDTYSSGTIYQVGDIVRYGGYNFIAINDTQGNLPTVTAFWAVLSTGFKHQGDFNGSIAYKPGDVVRYGAGVYVAKIDTAIGTIPTITASWDLLSQGQRWTGNYVANVTYVPGDLVRFGGYIYAANAVSTGNAPTSNAHFQIQTAGMDWKGNWSNVASYQLGEAVNYSNSSFISIITNNQNNIPLVTPNAWSLISQGSQDTFTTTQGDISYRSNSSGMVRLGIGTTGQVLSTDGIVPRWENNGSTGNVYYVAPEGVDAVGYGNTKQRPFGSIKYATQIATANATIYVAAGNYFEQLPMTLKAGTALVGDNQRTVIINPKAGLADDGISQCNTTTMFFMSDASIINKVTMKGMTGWTANVTNQENLASTIPAGVFVRLNPASPVNTKSPYVLECSAIGSGSIGALVDGNIHGAGNGNQSMIFHGYTIISSDGIGYWVRNAGRAEIVSCFTYFCKFGYATTGGGVIRSLNGNNSYGKYGAYSSGYDLNETPLVGNVFGDILTVSYSGGDFATGSFITGSTSGANAIITSNQISGNKLYLKRQSNVRFLNNEPIIGSLGGTANVTSSGNTIGQQGFIIVANGFASIPSAGSSIQFADDTQYAYVIQSVSGTYVNTNSTVTLVLTQDKPNRSVDTRPSGEIFTVVNNATTDYTVNGASDPTLTLYRGITYKFNISAANHPFWIKTAQVTGTASSYSTGVTNNGIDTGEITFVVPHDAPSTLYYICQHHAGMSGIINVVTPNITPGITIRKHYSQARLTGHDFLNIGTGNVITTNYPGTPTIPPAQGNEVVEDFPGRVYYISTDQDGNFRVGDYFRIDQATGTATLNASAFNLAGLTSLRLGSIGAQLGETINEFSSDDTLSGNSNLAVPTEYAVRSYVGNYVANAVFTSSGISANALAVVASNAAAATANLAASTANAIAGIAVNEIPFVNTISANRTIGIDRMAFSMGTLTLSGNAIYTISSNAYHFVLNPSGFALFN